MKIWTKYITEETRIWKCGHCPGLAWNPNRNEFFCLKETMSYLAIPSDSILTGIPEKCPLPDEKTGEIQ